MARVNVQRNRMVRDPNTDNFIETSAKMVKTFAGDPDYTGLYVIVSGVRVVIEGKIEEMIKQDEAPLRHRM